MLAKECSNIDEVNHVLLFDQLSIKSRELASKVPKASSYGDCKEIILKSDLVIEAASQEAVKRYGHFILDNGKDLMIMSIGALQDFELYERMVNLTKEKGVNLYIPSGAVAGIDGLKSASVAQVDSVELTTLKHPSSLEGAEYFMEKGINVSNIKEKTILFEGAAKEAVKKFPKNINVSAALSLAGIGFERTIVRIVADPNITTNTHRLKVKGRFGRLSIELQNYPSITNPRTSYLAALSAIATLRKVVSGIWLGT